VLRVIAIHEIDYDKLGDDLFLSDSCGHTTASLRTKEAFSSFIGFYGVSPIALTMRSILINILSPLHDLGCVQT